MTFEEKLDRAKVGSKAAYESLCLACIDSLYTAALISLKNYRAAANAVSSAISDGYTGISRIRDERHLRSWLVHELTKNTVDKLKEFKAEGTVHTASGVFADSGKLPDVERLVFAITACFGYTVHEISILTGMAENTVSDKLSSAKERLGDAYGAMTDEAAAFKAPETLKEKYRGFDESVARLERTASLPDIPVVQAPDITPPVVVEAPEPVQMQVVQETAVMEPVRPEEIAAEQVNEADTLEMPIPIPETDSDDEDVFVEETPEDEEEEDEDAAEEPAGSLPDAEESFTRQDAGNESGTFDAQTFISVVSAEKMKGSEFLRLIGNTRISNSVYREIETNPHLSKKRLIELLEQSPLTEADYYKMLTAIKHRREMLDAKEENRLALERAGLFDGSRRGRYKRRPKEAPQTELQMAIGLDAGKNDVSRERSDAYEPHGTYGDTAERDIVVPVRAVYERSGPVHPVIHPPAADAAMPMTAEPEDDDGAFTPVLTDDMFDEDGNTAEIPLIDEKMQEKYQPAPIVEPEYPAEEAPAEAAPVPAVSMKEEQPETFAATAGIHPVAGLSDTRPFEARFDMLEQEAAVRGSEEHGEGESITTDPLDNMTVTQIIEGAIPTEAGNSSAVGFAPDVKVSFDDTGELPVQALSEAEEDLPEEIPGPVGEDDDTAGERERYKGEEYFYDDSKYHEGDNRGKIIFCIVCAVLLAAGAALLYFMTSKSSDDGEAAETTVSSQTEPADEVPGTTETPAAEAFSEDAVLRAAVSLDEFAPEDRTDGRDERNVWDVQYMRASDEPFDSLFTESAFANGDMTYVFVKDETAAGTLYAVQLNGEETGLIGSGKFPHEELRGFAAAGDNIYAWRPHPTGPVTSVFVMNKELEIIKSCTVLASFTDAGIVDGKLIFVGTYTPRQGELLGETVPYYSSGEGEDETNEYIAAEDVSVIEGAKYCSSSVLFEPDSGRFTAVIGGYGTFAQFSDSGVTLIVPDEGCTYIVETGKDLRTKSVKRLKGEAFSAQCYRDDGLIGLQYTDTEHGVTAYKGGKTLTTQETPDEQPKEVARAIAWSGDTAYVRTLKYESGSTDKSSDMLYGFDMSGSEPASAKIEADDIYSEVLIKAGKYLAGVTGEAGADGERAGLRLSLYEYDGALKEVAYTIIELDENTPRENLKYIKSDAETDPAQLAVNEDGTLFAVPTEYFDGFSAVRRVVTLSFDGSEFTQVGELQLYDVKQTVPFISDDKLYVFTDKEIITENGSIPYTE